jgi:hypothetical protein
LAQAGGSQRFHVHEFWWVQDILELAECSAVVCTEFLLFGARKKEGKFKKKKKEKWLSSGQANIASGTVMCYKKLKVASKVCRYTLYFPNVLVVSW